MFKNRITLEEFKENLAKRNLAIALLIAVNAFLLAVLITDLVGLIS